MDKHIQSYLDTAKKLTQDNAHVQALKVVAMYVRHKHKNLEGVGRLEEYCNAIMSLHDFYGHMPDELNTIRKHIRNAIFSFLDDEETRRFNQNM